MLRREATQLFGSHLARALAVPRVAAVDAPEALVTLWPSHMKPSEGGEMLETTWPRFFDVLRAWRPFCGRVHHPGWTPATFAPMVRALANVRSVAALVVRVEGPGLAIEGVARAWESFYGMIHTTDRHSPVALGALVIIPYARPASAAEHARVSEWALSRSRDRGLPGDMEARKPARWLYLPGSVPGGAFETQDLDGDLLDPGTFVRTHSRR